MDNGNIEKLSFIPANVDVIKGTIEVAEARHGDSMVLTCVLNEWVISDACLIDATKGTMKWLKPDTENSMLTCVLNARGYLR